MDFNFVKIYLFETFVSQNIDETMSASYIRSLIFNNKGKMTGDVIIAGLVCEVYMLSWSSKTMNF